MQTLEWWWENIWSMVDLRTWKMVVAEPSHSVSKCWNCMTESDIKSQQIQSKKREKERKKADSLFKYENFIASLFHLNNALLRRFSHTKKGHEPGGNKERRSKKNTADERKFSSFDFNFHSFLIQSNQRVFLLFQPLNIFHPHLPPEDLTQLLVSVLKCLL